MSSEARDTRTDAMTLVLFAQVTARMSAIVPPDIAARAGTSNTLMRMFVAIDAMPGLMPSEIAAMLEADRSIVSRTLSTLQSLGLVSRRVDPADRRRVRVRLSARGRRQMADYEASIVPILKDISPITAQIVQRTGADPQATSTALGTPAAIIDHLAAVGTRVSSEMLASEREYGVARRATSFCLWAASAAPGSSAAEVSELVGLDLPRVIEAFDSLAELGLLTLSAASDSADAEGAEPRATATAAGEELVSAHAAAADHHLDELLTTLSVAQTA